MSANMNGYFAASLVISAIVAGPAMAQPNLSSDSCQSALSSLMSDWNSAGFAAPSKPSQQVVAGRDGRSTTGGQFTYMTAQIRAAHVECDRGDAQSALQRITDVRAMLDRAGKPSG